MAEFEKRRGSPWKSVSREEPTALEIVCFSTLRASCDAAQSLETLEEFPMGRGILLWLLGVPIPVIILIMLLFR